MEGNDQGVRRARALKRSYALPGSAVYGVGLELVGLSALDPLSWQEKWRRLAGGRFGFYCFIIFR